MENIVIEEWAFHETACYAMEFEYPGERDEQPQAGSLVVVKNSDVMRMAIVTEANFMSNELTVFLVDTAAFDRMAEVIRADERRKAALSPEHRRLIEGLAEEE